MQFSVDQVTAFPPRQAPNHYAYFRKIDHLYHHVKPCLFRTSEYPKIFEFAPVIQM